MFLTAELHHDAERDHLLDVNHCGLYRTVMKERSEVVEHKNGRLYYDILWDNISPKGNIYRFAGLETERLRNSADLWDQLDVIVETHKAKLKSTTHEGRCQEMIAALHTVEVEGCPSVDREAGAVRGFQPLLEFLSDTRADFWGPFVFPEELPARRIWFWFRFTVFMVAAIQIVAPLVILLYEWWQPSNRIRAFGAFLRMVTTPSEFFCLGTTVTDKLHSVMGVILFELIILIVHSYVLQQMDNSQKSGRLPMAKFWFVLGNITNMWCCALTVLFVPLLFWDEAAPTGTAMDSLTTLFIFMLDDFAGYASQYLGVSDDDFQRGTAWQMALLSQTPVTLSDLIDPAGQSADELWRIRYSAAGSLQVATEPSTACARRVERVKKSKSSSPLVSVETPHSVVYRNNLTRPGVEIPGWEAAAILVGWTCLHYSLVVMQVVFPLMWMAANKPCNEEDLAAQASATSG